MTTSIACRECGQKIAVRRGNCTACCQRLDEAIHAGVLTDEELVAQGRRLPPSDAGRKVVTQLFRGMKRVRR